MVRMAGVVLMIGMGWISARAQRMETAPAYAPLEISFSYSYARSNAAPGQCDCAAHGFDGLFPGAGGSLSGAASARAVLAGGGLDLTIHQHIAIRAIQADYLRTQLPNGKGNEQNLLRLGAGIVLRIW
jgi:hypothetical protein